MRDFFPGLAGIPAAKSSISFVDGERGILEYRGIRVEDLAEHSSFLETAFPSPIMQSPSQPSLS